jgi:hypothetical protein
MEDFLSRIDAPLLGNFNVTYNQILFDTTQFAQFIGRTPKLKAFKKPGFALMINPLRSCCQGHRATERSE